MRKHLLLDGIAEEEGNWKRMQLDWRRRFQVIAGVARGLLYLHEDAHTTIIHRDIKASNILLDGGWVPKIADFGLARLFPEDQSDVKTRVVGTNGYMAPEYVMRGSLSTKVDVFSFGVVVLELISGLKNSAFARISDPEASSLLEWVRPLSPCCWNFKKKKNPNTFSCSGITWTIGRLLSQFPYSLSSKHI